MSWMMDCVRRVGMLSKDDLVLEVQRLAKLEKAHAAQVIAHLAEIRRRKLYARFPMTTRLKAKLARLAEIQNVWNFEANLAELVEQAVDIALEKKDPRQRFERRRKRQAKQEADSARANDVDSAESPPDVPAGTDRYVPTELRDEVLHRAQYRCEFVSDHGTRCEERTRLEIDHIEPFAKGGATTVDNLRCLCRAHNLRHAERSYGIAFMQEKIMASQHNRDRLGA